MYFPGGLWDVTRTVVLADTRCSGDREREEDRLVPWIPSFFEKTTVMHIRGHREGDPLLLDLLHFSGKSDPTFVFAFVRCDIVWEGNELGSTRSIENISQSQSINQKIERRLK